MWAGHNCQIFLGLDILFVHVCNSCKLIFSKNKNILVVLMVVMVVMVTVVVAVAVTMLGSFLWSF